MRNNAKAHAPSLLRDLGMGKGAICLATSNYQTEVVVKLAEEDAITIVGKYKSELHAEVATYVRELYRRNLDFSDLLDIKIYCRVPTEMSAYTSLMVALYYAMINVQQPGITKAVLFNDLYEDEFLKGFTSAHELFAVLYGGLSIALEKNVLFQKVYLPKGLSGVLWKPRRAKAITFDALPPTYFANFILALHNSNLKILASGYKQITAQRVDFPIELLDDTVGIFPHSNLDIYCVLCLNTLSADSLLSQKVSGYKSQVLTIDHDGVDVY